MVERWQCCLSSPSQLPPLNLIISPIITNTNTNTTNTEGTFSSEPPFSQHHPLTSKAFDQPEQQRRIIEAIDSFDLKHTIEVLPALLQDEQLLTSAHSNSHTQHSSSHSRSNTNTNNNINAKTNTKNNTKNTKNTHNTAHHTSHLYEATQEATEGWNETIREDEEEDQFNLFSATWNPLGECYRMGFYCIFEFNNFYSMCVKCLQFVFAVHILCLCCDVLYASSPSPADIF